MATIFEDWIAEGRAKGIAKGIARGMVKGKMESILRVLTRRFQVVPSDMDAKIRSIMDSSLLDELIDEAVVCGSLDEFGGKLEIRCKLSGAKG